MKLKNYLLKLEEKENENHRENICIHGVSQIIREIYLDLKKVHKREVIRKLNEELNINYNTLSSWLIGNNPIPVSKAFQLLIFWKESCSESKYEFNEKWDLIFVDNKGFSQMSSRIVMLPRELNENLGYLIGFFQGDGHLKKENKYGFQEYSIYFYESSKEVLDMINNVIEEEFGIKGNIYLGTNQKGHRWHVLRITSKIIYLFMKNVLELRRGKTLRTTETPEIVKNSSLTIQLSFIKGFFDAEGAVGETIKNPYLEIGQASRDKPCEILIWVKDKLNENGIIFKDPQRNINRDFFRLRTARRENIKKFFEVVSSEHLDKKIKFERIIEKCQENQTL